MFKQVIEEKGKFIKYKVVQIWPGQTVTCLHTSSPGHIWTTLYTLWLKWWVSQGWRSGVCVCHFGIEERNLRLLRVPSFVVMYGINIYEKHSTEIKMGLYV
jgi:hypothetical protein